MWDAYQRPTMFTQRTLSISSGHSFWLLFQASLVVRILLLPTLKETNSPPVLALRQFLKRRKSFEMLLSSNSTGMQKNRYIRLMWLCCIDLVLSVPFQIYNLVNNLVNVPLFPWVSWADTQFDWYRVDFFRRRIIDLQPFARFNLIGYLVIQPLLSIVFFMLFGFTRETMKGYKNAFYFCMKPFGVNRPQRTATVSGSSAPRKRTWLDKLLGREAIPLNSTINSSNPSSSFPTFAQQCSGLPGKAIPFARANANTTQSSETETLDWEDDVIDIYRHNSVMIIDGRRFTIPRLNSMAV